MGDNDGGCYSIMATFSWFERLAASASTRSLAVMTCLVPSDKVSRFQADSNSLSWNCELFIDHWSPRTLCVPYTTGLEALRSCCLCSLPPMTACQSAIPLHHHLVPSIYSIARGLSIILRPLRDIEQCPCGCKHGGKEPERDESLPRNWHF